MVDDNPFCVVVARLLKILPKIQGLKILLIC